VVNITIADILVKEVAQTTTRVSSKGGFAIDAFYYVDRDEPQLKQSLLEIATDEAGNKEGERVNIWMGKN
jgi:hypothetical protein